jgi:outer membrane murein-binding lipoprotein Lpp
MKKLLIGLFLIFVLVLSGCVSNGTSVEQVLLANQMINDFKDQLQMPRYRLHYGMLMKLKPIKIKS